jgi:hypothetical protein
MDELLKALAQYPILIIVIGILIALALTATIFMYLVAFLQGREISFGQFKIGARTTALNQQTNKTTSQKNTQKDNESSVYYPKIEWPPRAPNLTYSCLAPRLAGLCMMIFFYIMTGWKRILKENWGSYS